MSTLSIGQIAEQAGVAIDTVRYYERNGLLAPPPVGRRRGIGAMVPASCGDCVSSGVPRAWASRWMTSAPCWL